MLAPGRGVEAEDRQLLERLTVAVERLAEDPVIHMETGPPVCPHCERINPSVHVDNVGGSGPLAEFVIRAKCDHCTKLFFAFPTQWQAISDLENVTKAIQAHKELGGYGSNGTDK